MHLYETFTIHIFINQPHVITYAINLIKNHNQFDGDVKLLLLQSCTVLWHHREVIHIYCGLCSRGIREENHLTVILCQVHGWTSHSGMYDISYFQRVCEKGIALLVPVIPRL